MTDAQHRNELVLVLAEVRAWRAVIQDSGKVVTLLYADRPNELTLGVRIVTHDCDDGDRSRVLEGCMMGRMKPPSRQELSEFLRMAGEALKASGLRYSEDVLARGVEEICDAQARDVIEWPFAQDVGGAIRRKLRQLKARVL